MGDIEETYRNRIAALLHAFQATTFVRADNVPSKIEQGLFLGSLGAACNKTKLKSLGITHVLTVANAIKPPYPDDFVCKKIEVADREETNLGQHFDECFKFIDEARKTGGGVLVHCFAGRSRSVTIVVAYLMKEHRITASEALGRVKSKRPQAAPNAGFLSQLRNFESALGVLFKPLFRSKGLNVHIILKDESGLQNIKVGLTLASKIVLDAARASLQSEALERQNQLSLHSAYNVICN